MPGIAGEDYNMNENRIWNQSGSMRDAIQTLNLFSGIQYGLPMTDLHLQGGQKGDHRMMLDGVPVYNPYSFGQMFSAFSPFAINKINLHKAGYGVQEGSQIAGLINLNHDISGGENLGFLAQGDPLSLNWRVDLQFPAGSNSPLKIMSAFRTNYWNVYRNPILNRTLSKWDEVDPLIMNLVLDGERESVSYETMEHDSNVQFHDFHLAAQYQLNTYHELFASFYDGKNFVSTDLLAQAFPSDNQPEFTYARDQYKWNNLMSQVTHNWIVNPHMDLTTRISYSENSLDHRYLFGNSLEPYIPDTDAEMRFQTTSAAFEGYQNVGSGGMLPTQNNENRIRHLIIRSDVTYNFSRQFTLNTGLQFDRVSSIIDLSDLFYLPTQSDHISSHSAGYVDGTFFLGEYWKANLGSRFTFLNRGGGFYMEPRAGIQYDQYDSNSGYWSFKLSGGVYR